MSTPGTVDRWQPTLRETVAALAVLVALAAVASFAIWGMRPSTAARAPSQVAAHHHDHGPERAGGTRG